MERRAIRSPEAHRSLEEFSRARQQSGWASSVASSACSRRGFHLLCEHTQVAHALSQQIEAVSLEILSLVHFSLSSGDALSSSGIIDDTTNFARVVPKLYTERYYFAAQFRPVGTLNLRSHREISIDGLPVIRPESSQGVFSCRCGQFIAKSFTSRG